MSTSHVLAYLLVKFPALRGRLWSH